MKKLAFAAGALALILAAAAPSLGAAHNHAGHAKGKAAAPAPITAPAGDYVLDKSHASLTFRVKHLGLSMYTARFADFNAALTIDPKNPAAARLTATVNPASVRTDYPGDYKATHANSPYATWDEDLAKNPEWFNANAHPQITFTSTRIRMNGARAARVTGDLAFRGVTVPITLDVAFNGEAAPPWLGGRKAIGFSAKGKLNRSAFGMSRLVPNIGDEVELIIEAEFWQKAN
jgi:polyisoprenoid-binding protein YceI